MEIIKNQLTVCNVDLHNDYCSEPFKFYDRIKHLRQMRTKPSDESFSYFITSEYELNRLKSLQLGIKSGQINFLDYGGHRSEYIFALNMNKSIVDWLYYSSVKDLEKQLIAWMAVLYFFNIEDRKILDKQFHQRLLSRAKKLIRDDFPKYFQVSSHSDGFYYLKKGVFLSREERMKKYCELCKDYYGSEPRYPLDNPIGYSMRTDEFGVIGPKIHFNYSFMYERDWNSIVLNGVKDDLQRAESSSYIIQDWREVITKHEISAHHIYNGNSEEPEKDFRTQCEGFIYLLSNESFRDNLFKIGYTTRTVEERANQLYTSGVPTPFNIEYRLPVKNLRKIEEVIHHELRKNRINPEREFFHGNKDDFIKTIRKYETYRSIF